MCVVVVYHVQEVPTRRAAACGLPPVVCTSRWEALSAGRAHAQGDHSYGTLCRALTRHSLCSHLQVFLLHVVMFPCCRELLGSPSKAAPCGSVNPTRPADCASGWWPAVKVCRACLFGILTASHGAMLHALCMWGSGGLRLPGYGQPTGGRWPSAS